MSTISDALKKAQRQRAVQEPERWKPEPAAPLAPPVRRLEEPVAPAGSSPVGGIVSRIQKRGPQRCGG